MKSDVAPHDCPECGGSAYVGLNQVECVNPACRHWHDDTYLKHRNLTDDGQEEIGLSLSDYLFEHDKTPTTGSQLQFGGLGSWLPPTIQSPDFWKSTLKPLPAIHTWSVDPIWIHQVYVGDAFTIGGCKYRVQSIDRFSNEIVATP